MSTRPAFVRDQAHLESRAPHRQVRQLPLEPAARRTWRRDGARPTADARRRGMRRGLRAAACSAALRCSARPVQGLALGFEAIAALAITSSRVGPCFRFSRSSSASRSSTSCSRAGDASMRSAVVAQGEREVLELRLDGVAGLEVRAKRRVDRRQLRDALPDPSERGQHGAFRARRAGRSSRWQRRLDALGVRQHLTGLRRAARPLPTARLRASSSRVESRRSSRRASRSPRVELGTLAGRPRTARTRSHADAHARFAPHAGPRIRRGAARASRDRAGSDARAGRVARRDRSTAP